jgi:cellulose synthase/poly-beta-1,6-N-acetylglucosamine synthase-like glycosyltransferase
MTTDTLLILFLWVAIIVVFYSYAGYGLLLFVLIKIKRLLFGEFTPPQYDEENLPEVTFMVAAYNEESWIEEKIRNTLALDYPADKLRIYFVTDGTTDDTNKKIVNFPTSRRIELFFQQERRGKIAAVERVMEFVETPITVFTDANTDINPQAIRQMIRHFANPKVGAVAGEKRVRMGEKDDAGASEGLYWKYESLLKKWDSELYSVVGAAGELFALRTDLYEPVEKNTLIEDFVMTMRIAKRRYKVVYEPSAYAVESKSASVSEELKRKIRISAGGLQAVWRLRAMLNFLPYPLGFGCLSFQYISHRVLRWTLAPLFLPLIFLVNLAIVLRGGNLMYELLLGAQILFYLAAALGWILESKQLKIKALFVPYYFCMMNYSVYHGLFRLIKGSQSAIWVKAVRSDEKK